MPGLSRCVFVLVACVVSPTGVVARPTISVPAEFKALNDLSGQKPPMDMETLQGMIPKLKEGDLGKAASAQQANDKGAPPLDKKSPHLDKMLQMFGQNAKPVYISGVNEVLKAFEAYDEALEYSYSADALSTDQCLAACVSGEKASKALFKAVDRPHHHFNGLAIFAKNIAKACKGWRKAVKDGADAGEAFAAVRDTLAGPKNMHEKFTRAVAKLVPKLQAYQKDQGMLKLAEEMEEKAERAMAAKDKRDKDAGRDTSPNTDEL